MSGPYALEAFGDAVLFGNVDLGSTVFTPLLSTSYQKAYGNIYGAPSDLYSATYASRIETLLPSTLPLATIFSTGRLPETALFDSSTPVVNVPNQPVLSPIAGVPLTAVAPTQPLRLAFYKNDLRNGASGTGTWAPTSPTLLCGGDQDPDVFFQVNTEVMAAFWHPLVVAGLITVLDVNAMPGGPFAALQTGFQESQAAQLAFYESVPGGSFSATAAAQLMVEGYHASVAPFCSAAARAFFSEL